jgi:dissimilatory sulfite reductase alpha subunit
MWMEGELKIDNAECTRCMHCINVMPRALRPGKDQGATICHAAPRPRSSKAPSCRHHDHSLRQGQPRRTNSRSLVDYIEKIWDWWMEVGKNRERSVRPCSVSDCPPSSKVMEIEPIPQHVKEPRSNPYVFWKEEEVEGGWERDIKEFRKRHAM